MKNEAFKIEKDNWTNEQYDEWFNSLKRQKTPTGSRNNQFEIKYAGEDNVQVFGETKSFWVDGIENETVLEVKFILDAAKSPYIFGSKTPDFIREKILSEVRSEFERISLILKDKSNPLTELRVIINKIQALAFFEMLLNEFKIYGEVVVKPE